MNPKKLGLELLEKRELMAGNVSVALDRFGTLKITGDNQANSVTIDRLAPGQFVIRPGDTTTLNGQRGELKRSNIVSVSADMRGGNDTLMVRGYRTPTDNIPDLHNISINMGTGVWEHVRIQQLDVGGKVGISTGSGEAYVQILDNTLADATIVTGQRKDIVQLRANSVSGSMRVDTGGGNDYVWLDNVNGVGNPRKQIRSLAIDLGAGNDRLDLYEVIVDNIYADLGAGDDHLNLRDADLRAGRIHAQAGADTYWHEGRSSGKFGHYGFEKNQRWNKTLPQFDY